MTRQSTDWQGSFNAGLIRKAQMEWRIQRSAHLKRRRSIRTFRYVVPQWQSDAIEAMARNDEEAAKAAVLYR